MLDVIRSWLADVTGTALVPAREVLQQVVACAVLCGVIVEHHPLIDALDDVGPFGPSMDEIREELAVPMRRCLAFFEVGRAPTEPGQYAAI